MLFTVFAAASLLGNVPAAAESAEDTTGTCDCHSTCTGNSLMFNCGIASSDRWRNPCQDESFAALPFCDETLSIENRVIDLLKRIPDSEKLGSAGTSTPLSNYAAAMPSVGVPHYQWWNEALHGLASSPGVQFDETAPYASSFPQIISISHSFNRTLFALIGAAIGTEIRAFSNLRRAGLTYWTPNLNIFRDPRWGRGQETPGEDPYLTSQYAKAYIPSLQYDAGVDSRHLKVSACCKHFAAYSLEDFDGVDRHHFNAEINNQDLADTYMPAFESCISPGAGGASCIMCSYNELNGVPTCADKDLLTTLARETWGFNGYITSDCGAVEDIYTTHKYASTPEEAIFDALHAGVDIECGEWMDFFLQSAVSSGLVSMEMVNRALSNLFEIHMRLGNFDTEGTGYDNLGMADVNTLRHQQIASEAARQAIVLLKNNEFNLPFSSLDGEKFAIIGPNADATITMQGNYFGVAPYLISPLDALRTAVSDENIIYVRGCDINSTSTADFESSMKAVKNSDNIILVMGIDQTIEAEGLDRTSIELPGNQQDLIETVLQASNGKHVVLVLFGGGALCLARYKDDIRVASIIFAGYPGQSGGQGLMDIILGRESPSGRLTQTFYNESFLDEVSFYNMNMRPSQSSLGRGYRFYTGFSVVYEFGHGLSYTTFVYKWVNLGVASVSTERLGNILVTASINVTNTGDKYTAAETVLLFLFPPTEITSNLTYGAPIKKLTNFEKISLAPGDYNVLQFSLAASDFLLADSSGMWGFVRGAWTLKIGSLSRRILIR